MKDLKEWKEFYEGMGIKVSLYNTDVIETAVGLNLILGENDIRVLFIKGLHNKSYSIRKIILDKVLDGMYLSREYPWVINSHNEITVIVRCKEDGNRMFNSPPLLWNGKKVIVYNYNPSYFFNGSNPTTKPFYVSTDILVKGKDIISGLYDFLAPDVLNNFNFPDFSIDTFNESWTLKDFLEAHGPKMQLGGWPLKRDPNGEYYPVVRFGDIGAHWVYAYVSLRMRNISIENIIENQEFLRVGKVSEDHYILYDNSPKSYWLDVNLNLK